MVLPSAGVVFRGRFAGENFAKIGADVGTAVVITAIFPQSGDF